MSAKLKVQILKKSKDAPYPEHIIVERPETYEMAHLYFDEGLLKRFTHIKRDPKIKMLWNKQEKRYKALLPNYVVLQDAVRNEQAGFTYLKGPEDQTFFSFSAMPPWNMSSIMFCSSLNPYGPSFFVEMDLNDKCVPNHYVGPFSSADIKEIYPHQKRRVTPLKHFFERKER